MKAKEFEKLFPICQQLWNDYDPIGVTDFGVDDEYNDYIPQTVKLVLLGADKHKLSAFVKEIVRVNMGLESCSSKRMESFVDQLVYFQKNIHDSPKTIGFLLISSTK